MQSCRRDFAEIFEKEATTAMTLVDENQYEALFSRYIEHIVAQVKREKIFNKNTSSYEQPSEALMKDVETILNIPGPADKHREAIIGRIAATKIERPTESINVSKIFHEYLDTMKSHYYEERKHLVDDNFRVMLALENGESLNFTEEERNLANSTYEQLETRFGYTRAAAAESLRFLLTSRVQPT
ncbi:MAG: hypothetical protein EOP10_29130 [Proteobacteria bacterium]|nr:MAG: hypothetical protein EOP10_29130 [Pseudomonadota bacterium]